ncbi:MAG: GNAT family N-acetyltransferase [Caulobacterales bacterium]|jgi:GNAT superfamily N-acetyltransferase
MQARQLTLADVDAARALRLRGLQEHPRDFGAAYEDEAALSREEWARNFQAVEWYGVERDGALVACAILRIPAMMKLKHNGWIHGMYVAPEARGTPAGGLLIAAIEARACAAGLGILKLLATSQNARAVRFYEKCGFAAYGLEPDSHRVDGVSYDSLEMMKRLNPA